MNSRLFYFLLFYYFFPSVSGLPIVLSVSSVVRSVGKSDTIRSTSCPAKCERFHASPSFTDSCSCTCPIGTPTYISSNGMCVDRIEECAETLRWKSINSFIPVIELRPHTIILPDYDLDFQNSPITVSSKGEASCAIRHILYENIHTKWKHLPISDGLFQLTSTKDKPILYFGGTEEDVTFLLGAVVVVKMDCERVSSPVCLSLRIAGSSDRLSFLDHRESAEVEEPEWRIQTTVLLVMVIIVIAVLIITSLVWNVCWRMKKRKLISDFQMQFVQQYRNAQERLSDLHNHNFETIDEQEITTSSQGLTRKRLIFSAEYFDHGQMLDPSPLALQFLHDLRRVVDVARDRIRQRRFIPSLSCIVEEAHERCYSNPAVPVAVPVEQDSYESSAHSSPQTEPKSVDSGRESREGSEEDEDDKPAASSKVSDIVKSFESKKSTPTTPTNNPRPSLVPIMLNSSMRIKNRKLKPVTPTDTPDSSPTEETPPTKTPFQSKIKPPTSLAERKSTRERKGYAVFPSDGTFNKSLPRRTKRFSNPKVTT